MQTDNKSRHVIPFGWHVPTQRMLSAKDTSRGRSCDCICVACGARLQARQGSTRIWHFAHDEETQCQHAPEAAIHRMAKQMIAERSAVYVPAIQRSRTIRGERDVWRETITVDVQIAGLQTLMDCVQEKNITHANLDGGIKRPDVLATLDGSRLAIEIRNTHAVDFDKQAWLKNQGFSTLEIYVADLASLPSEEITDALNTRLFESAGYSDWLTHVREQDAVDALDRLETQIRDQRREDEQALLAKLEAEEAAQKRKEAARERFRDIEDFKFRLFNCTIRVARNHQRATITIFRYAPDLVFEGIKQVARKHGGTFNDRWRRWEFYRNTTTETIFKQLCEDLKPVCFASFVGIPVAPLPSAKPVELPKQKTVESIPVYFDDPAMQEAFDERAGILEFDACFSRVEAEMQALELVGQHN